MDRTKIKALMREAGLRATGPRVSVYAMVKKQSRPVSHSQLVKLMEDEDLDSATIYRNLVRLSDVGLLRVVSRANGMARYVQSDSTEQLDHDHAHFVCSDCDVISCLPEDAQPKPKAEGIWSESLASAQTDAQWRDASYWTLLAHCNFGARCNTFNDADHLNTFTASEMDTLVTLFISGTTEERARKN